MSHKAKYKSFEIEPIIYKGSVSDFRGWMERLFARGANRMAFPLPEQKMREMRKKALEESGGKSDLIQFNSFKSLYVNYSERDQEKNREVWYVFVYDPTINQTSLILNKWATILAIEQPANITTVQFLDGIYFRRETENGEVVNYARGNFIGDMLSNYAEYIKDELRKETEEQAGLPDDDRQKLTKIDPLTYPGSVAHFRAKMDRYLAGIGNKLSIEIQKEQKDFEIFHDVSAQESMREVWHIQTPYVSSGDLRFKEQYHGMILATEDSSNKTIVDFIDGQYYDVLTDSARFRRNNSVRWFGNPPPNKSVLMEGPPIGDDFLVLVEHIKSGLQLGPVNAPDLLPQEPQTRKLDDWFDYLHAEGHRTRIKLEYIAEKTGYEYSYVRKMHSLYLKAHEAPKKRKVTKSNKK